MSDNPQLIYDYFPGLTSRQKNQIGALHTIYAEWNEKINVISRKDIDNLYEKHCLHSLGIAKIYQFKPNQKVMDVGTGGGFPGIPLAILFPESQFLLVDSVKKKIKVVDDIVSRLALTNVTTSSQRAELINDRFHFIVCRAVTSMKPFYHWVNKKIIRGNDSDGHPYGIISLKGGDLVEEMRALKLPYILYDLKDHFNTPFFETKAVVLIPFKK